MASLVVSYLILCLIHSFAYIFILPWVMVWNPWGFTSDTLANRSEFPFLFLSLPGGLKISGVELHLFFTPDWGHVAFMFARI